jgi:ADP-ribose pyrophosphatase
MRNQSKPLSRVHHETPWTRWVERPWGKELWYGLEIDDYVQVIARTRDGRYPLVKQFRPAVGEVTVELVAGLVDGKENELETAQRELREEAGLVGGDWTHLDTRYSDTGRLDNRVHTFVALDVVFDSEFIEEEGVEPCFVDAETLESWVLEGRLSNAIQVMGYLLAKSKEILPLD